MLSRIRSRLEQQLKAVEISFAVAKSEVTVSLGSRGYLQGFGVGYWNGRLAGIKDMLATLDKTKKKLPHPRG